MPTAKSSPTPNGAEAPHAPDPGHEMTGWLRQIHRQGLQAAHEPGVPPPKVRWSYGEAEVRVPGQECAEGDLRFGEGEWRAQASVDSVTEGQVSPGVAVSIGVVGVRVPGGVSISCSGREVRSAEGAPVQRCR
ncbi:hypothetical protein GCM10010357_69240 [Streptomyces luteireticuli]|uniref:Uncharacterized protein n=1 Tax=Streptomyces luteireticuli TaxID=173858 RepID=A0ABP3J1Y8_9ACTN